MKPDGYCDLPSQSVSGLAAWFIAHVLRGHLRQELHRHVTAGALKADRAEEILEIAAGIARAGEMWRNPPHATPASGDDPAEAAGPMRLLRPDLMTTREAGDVLGLSAARVKELAQQGVLGQKVGRDWVFTRDEIEAHRATEETPHVA